jgi:hypothetical protein
VVKAFPLYSGKEGLLFLILCKGSEYWMFLKEPESIGQNEW